jgi:cellobiose phosphorylase
MITGKFPAARFRIILHGEPEDFKVGGCEMLYHDKKDHGDHLMAIEIKEANAFCMSFIGEVCKAVQPVKIEDPDDQYESDSREVQSAWNDLSLGLSLNAKQEDILAIREILPWYGMNALIHFLTPYGLEQFSGAAWGTRDVSQGPVDLLLSLGKYDEARQVLLIIFSNQNADGGWPQWWMFDSYRHIRAQDSHGDVFDWCLIALSNYIRMTGDWAILDEMVDYYRENSTSSPEKTPVSEHVDRLINMVVKSFIPGTALVPYGGGDWNDSLQPVSRELAQRMVSSWTVEMNYQAFKQYQAVCEQTGKGDKAAEMKDLCERIKADFNEHLVKGGTVAGYGLVEDDGSISLLLHPGDNTTGVHYSILPMERGILSGIFTTEQANHHLDLIDKYLKGPDGARLMDRPLKYKGGIQTVFQRAESSTFFGREIGLMYVHEHIRYAEALAVMGRADAFLHALRQAIPVAYREIVPCGDIRQANCYYSSSDVAFRNRYEADERYDEIRRGEIRLRGGWRVYSSGPGIYISLVYSRLLGLRVHHDAIIIDPVMPNSLNGFAASLDFLGRSIRFEYQIRENNFGPSAILVNGKPVSFTREENKYRLGGAVIQVNRLNDLLHHEGNIIEVRL